MFFKQQLHVCVCLSQNCYTLLSFEKYHYKQIIHFICLNCQRIDKRILHKITLLVCSLIINKLQGGSKNITD